MVDSTFQFASSSFSGIQWNLLFLVEINECTLSVHMSTTRSCIHFFSFDDNILYNKIEKKISGSRSTYTFRAQIPGYKLTPLFAQLLSRERSTYNWENPVSILFPWWGVVFHVSSGIILLKYCCISVVSDFSFLIHKETVLRVQC